MPLPGKSVQKRTKDRAGEHRPHLTYRGRVTTAFAGESRGSGSAGMRAGSGDPGGRGTWDAGNQPCPSPNAASESRGEMTRVEE